jgi:hypothetical protein
MPRVASGLDPASPDPPDRVRLLKALARASTPAERANHGWLQVSDPASGRARLAAWVTAVAGDRPERAAAVLAARGLDPDGWERALCDVQPATDLLPAGAGLPRAALPDWVHATFELADLAGSAGSPGPIPTLGEAVGTGLPQWVDPDQPWRFHAVFAGWMAAADARIDDWCRAAGAGISPAGHADLRWWLVRRLLSVAGPTLMAVGEPAIPPRQWWADIWVEFPVLARLMARTWLQWQDVCAELVTRLARDLPGITAARVTRVRVGAGDQHAGGRSVVAVSLADGQVLFGKPYPDPAGPLLAGLLGQLDRIGPPLGLAVPVTHHRAGWTWTEQVSAQECRDDADVADWYWRAGALLAVLTAVGATDCHHENLIATRLGPVLVDLETVLGPAPSDNDPVAKRMAASPVSTAMITSVTDGRPGQPSIDIGALAAPSARTTPYPVATLAPGSPDGDGTARLVRAPVPVATASSLPRLRGHRVGVAAHAEQVCAGFTEVCDRMARLGGPDQVLAAGADGDAGSAVRDCAGVRFVARPTQVYARLLAAAGSAQCLRDGVSRELVLERLWLAAGQADPALIQAEQDALRELDVPRFVVPLTTAERIIGPDARVIPHGFTASPLAHARARIAQLAVAGCADQLLDLQAALFAADPQPLPVTNRPVTSRDAPSADPSDLIAILISTALPGPDGPNWVGLEYDPSRLRWRFGRLGPGLTGIAGIGLTLALAHPDAPAARLGREALLSCATRIGTQPGWTCQDGATGVAGVAWAVARAASHLGDDELMSRAMALLPVAMRAARGAGSIPCGFTMDPVAATTMAVLELPPGSQRDTALDELCGLLDQPLPQARRRPRDAAAGWATSFPSSRAARALARAELGIEPGNTGETVEDVPVSWGDAVVLAHLGRLGEQEWSWLRDRASTTWDRLELAVIAATAAGGCERTAPPMATDGTGSRWAVRAARARDGLRAGIGRFPPIRANLSAIHGTAALAILGIGDHPEDQGRPPGRLTANVRILR